MAITPRVLIAVRDDNDVSEICASLLDANYDITVADCDEDLIAIVQQNQPHLVLVGVDDVNRDCIDWVGVIKNDSTSIVMAVIKLSDADAIRRSIAVGVDDFLTTPVRRTATSVRIAKILRLHDTLR